MLKDESLSASRYHFNLLSPYDCAKAAGVTPQEWVDKIAGEIRSIWDRMGASYDQFIRTTDKGHEPVVQKIFPICFIRRSAYLLIRKK